MSFSFLAHVIISLPIYILYYLFLSISYAQLHMQNAYLHKIGLMNMQFLICIALSLNAYATTINT